MLHKTLRIPSGVSAPEGVIENLCNTANPTAVVVARQPYEPGVGGPVTRPGISAGMLFAAGIEHIDAATAQQRCGISQPGLWIPYRDLDGAPIMDESAPYGRLRLDHPRGDRKYHQRSGSVSHVYFPPGLRPLLNSRYVVIVEGEFKALSLVEAGIAAIGISGFYGHTEKAGDAFKLLPELATALQKGTLDYVYFLGDGDTAFNPQFADSACRLAEAFNRTILLPRIPVDQLKGIDDCRGLLRDRFISFWDEIVRSAVPVNPRTDCDALKVQLVLREIDAVAKLDAAARAEAERRIIKLAATVHAPVAIQKLQAFMLQAFGIKTRTFGAAVKVERKETARILNDRTPWLEGMPSPDGRPRVLLPGPDREVSAFAGDVGRVMALKPHWFSRVNTPCVVATDAVTGAATFENLDPARSVSSLEQVAQTGVIKRDPDGGDPWFEPLSMRIDAATLLIKSDQLRNALPRVDRILEVPLPIMTPGRTVVLPSRGYNPDLKIWVSPSAPAIAMIPVVEAYQRLDWVLQGFAFVGPQDRTHYIAHLLTHMAAGFFPSWSTRTPLYVYLANRPRVGKDYLAGTIGVLFEGHAIEESPLTDDEPETTKRLVTAMRKGRRRLHFSNCAGALESPAFEAFLTNALFTGRLLGVSDDITVANETVVSISGRTGLTVSPDLALRSRIISQTWHQENINARTFPVPNLHDELRRCRGEILSAVYTFVMTWVEQGCPAGPTSFASFPDWARVVGGIMAVNNLGDPCLPHVDGLLPMDRETEDMKTVFATMRNLRGDQPATSADIMGIVKAAPDENLFPQFDLTKPGERAKFGQMLRRYDKRVLGGIRLEFVPNKKSERSKYRFFATEMGGGGEDGGLISLPA